MVLEEDILQGRKGAQCVSYLSSGMDCGVHVAGLGSGQTLETQKTGKELGEDRLFISPILKGRELSSFIDVTETIASSCNKSGCSNKRWRRSAR